MEQGKADEADAGPVWREKKGGAQEARDHKRQHNKDRENRTVTGS